MKEKLVTTGHKHSFHLVSPSPWPFVASMASILVTIGAVLAMHHIDHYLLYVGLTMLVLAAFGWWKDVVSESKIPGLHNKTVQIGLRMGMVLFIVSEIMFFVAFFGAYFYSAFSALSSHGGVWPPKGVITFDPFHLPYLNTLLLLLSGTTVTWAHHSLLEGNRKGLIQGLILTVIIGFTFTVVQGIEYAHAAFALKDGIYPSAFFLATGFHGVHVIIGTIFLAVCLFRAKSGDFTVSHHIGFEAAAWYWHFVDVVWLFLFVSIYWWGGGATAAH